MKKLFFTCLALMATAMVRADYSGVEFITVDGGRHIVAGEGLTMTIADGLMTITNTAGEQLQLEVDKLSTMQFTDETISVDLTATDSGSAVSVYNLNGTSAGSFNSLDAAAKTLTPGVYVIKNEQGETFKAVISQ